MMAASNEDVEKLAAQIADLQQRNWELQDEAELLRHITEEAGVAYDPPSALMLVLRNVANRMGWALGQAWLPRGAVLVRGPAWYEHAVDLGTFKTGSEDLRLGQNSGAPSRAWATRDVAWEQGAAVAARFARVAFAHKAEVMSAVALPIRAGIEVVAVLEFFVAAAPAPDDPRVQGIARVVSQLGTVIRQKQVEVELRRQKDLFESLTAVARATAAGPTLEATLRNALNVAVQLTEAEHGSLFQLDEDGRVTGSILGHSGLIERHAAVDGVMNRGLAGWVARHAQPALLADTQQDDRWLTLPNEAYVVRSALVVPILSEGQVRGVLSLLHSAVGHFTPSHQMLLQAAADQMALAMRNAQSYEAQRRAAEQRSTMYEVLRALTGWFGADAVARAAVQSIAQYTGRTSVAMAIPDGTAPDQWVIRAAVGELSPPVGATRPLGAGVIGRVFMSGATQYVPDVTLDDDYLPAHATIRSELAVPVWRGERVLGVLNLESEGVDDFNRGEIALAESLADAVALALDNARLYQAVADDQIRLEALIESSRDGIVLIGTDGMVRVVNRAALRLLRLPGRPDDWLQRPMLFALRRMRSYAPTAARMAAGEMRRARLGVPWEGQGECVIAPRTLVWMNLPVVAGITQMGRLLVLRDVTQERELEHLRDDLMHTIVHDLRNPLTAMMGALSVMELTATLNPQMLDVARSGAEQMLRLVNMILDVSRLESGQMPLTLGSVALAPLVADLFQIQLPLAAEHRIRLESEIPADFPLLWGDEGLIKRVLQNLVGNALQFAPSDSAVCVRAEAPPQGAALIKVVDSGPGIAPEVQARLFQKFASSQGAERGTGLGLAFCRLAIEAHGGSIWVESAPGQGTTFLFTLPFLPRDGHPGAAG
jgi:signal transduction histidine kinase